MIGIRRRRRRGREGRRGLPRGGRVVRDRNVFATLQAPPLSEALHDVYGERGVDLRLGSTDAPEADLEVAGIGVELNL